PANSATSASGNALVVIKDANIAVSVKQEAGSDRDGKLMFLGKEIKPWTIVPPDRQRFSFSFLYLVVEVAYDETRLNPSGWYPLAGTPENETNPITVRENIDGKKMFFKLSDQKKPDELPRWYTRWQEHWPVFCNHVEIMSEVRQF